MSKLTPKQRLFVDEYLIDLNATQAAIRAGYSKKTAGSIGNENLQKPEIKKLMADRLEQLEKSKIMDVQEVMELLTRIARNEETQKNYDVFGNAYDREATLKERMIASEMIGKRWGMFMDRIAVSEAAPVIVDDIPRSEPDG